MFIIDSFEEGGLGEGSVHGLRWLNSPFRLGPAGRRIDDVVVVEASAPKVYPRVILASASTLSGSVVRTLWGGEGSPRMFCLAASSLGQLHSQCSIGCGGVEEIGVGFQQWSVAGSEALEEDRVRSVASGHKPFDQESPPYTSAVREFTGGGSISG